MPFIPGTTLGSYEVTAKIGEGGIVSVAANVRLVPKAVVGYDAYRGDCTTASPQKRTSRIQNLTSNMKY